MIYSTDPNSDWFAANGLNATAPTAGSVKMKTSDQVPPGKTASGGVKLPGYTYDADGNITGLPKVLGGEPGDKVTDVNGGLKTPGGMQTVIHTNEPSPSDPWYYAWKNEGFPANPTDGQTYQANGRTFIWGKGADGNPVWLPQPGLSGDNRGGSGGKGVPDPLNPDPFTYAPFTDQFTNPDFVAPTGLTEQNDPGFRARLAMGAQQIQASAAGKGTLLSGQTVEDLNQRAQDFASNEFSNVYNRALTGYQQNSQNNWQQYSQKYQQYLNGFQQALQGYNTNLGAGQQAFGDTLGLSSMIFGQNQQNWQNKFNATSLGLNAANASANLGANNANSAGGYLTGIGNANASGTIGAANGNLYGLGQVTNGLNSFLQASPFFQSAYGSKGWLV